MPRRRSGRRRAGLLARTLRTLAGLAAAVLAFAALAGRPAGGAPRAADGQAREEANIRAAAGTTAGRTGARPAGDGRPAFSEAEKAAAAAKGAHVALSPLDALGRAGRAVGLFDKAHMPAGPRAPLRTRPAGWVQRKCPESLVEGGWLYNRCHLLGFQLSGLQDEPRNLITGTRQMNVELMLPFENIVADHLREFPGHQVLYSADPVHQGAELVPRGVEIQADCLQCDEIDYRIFIPNIQDGIAIDYATGESRIIEKEATK